MEACDARSCPDGGIDPVGDGDPDTDIDFDGMGNGGRLNGEPRGRGSLARARYGL